MDTQLFIKKIHNIQMSSRIAQLKQEMLEEPRYLSIEQARIITEYYKNNQNKPRNIQRAEALAEAMRKIQIRIDAKELIVGNRSAGVRAGVISPEAGISWIDREIENLPTRPQDKFNVRLEDIEIFRNEIFPFWRGKSLEDKVNEQIGDEIRAIEKVAKINQTDHAQGHICPNVEKWLRYGPKGLFDQILELRKSAEENKAKFYDGELIVLEATTDFIRRYATLARTMSRDEDSEQDRENLNSIAERCEWLAENPPKTFHDAVQLMWFLFVILQLESNASSFSPGRADQYLYPYYRHDIESGILDEAQALEIIEALWLKFNQIVYLRNSNSAKYFAGFPIGFNIAIGGLTPDGKDASNELSFLFLKAQEHIGLPQPNLSARLSLRSSNDLLKECARVIGKGSGMPQIFNDESIIPALEARGISHEDALNYAIVGCVELSTHGNSLGWSDAGMFNMVKALELTLNHGVCLLTGKQIGLDLGSLEEYRTYEELEDAFRAQIDHFLDRMIKACDIVDRLHAQILPSPFLSAVIDGCNEKALDVTAGGAVYNLSGIQAIQVANIADSLAVIKKCVYEDHSIDPKALMHALRTNWDGAEILRQFVINKVPKYGNDVEWVDNIGKKWVKYFAERLRRYANARGGIYHAGLYTVSAHIPMGHNVGASPDGRKASDPLADGGMSAMYGRDRNGPTALLRSVSRIDPSDGSNGTLLNMKFLPELFKTEEGLQKFSDFLKTFINLHINHVQFNVVRREDLIAAKKNPEQYRGLIVRVAGYTAYFVELANDLQDEIIERTSYGTI